MTSLLLACGLVGCVNAPSSLREANPEEAAAVQRLRQVWYEQGLTDPCPVLDDLYVAEMPQVPDLMDWCHSGSEGILACVYVVNRTIADIPGSTFVYVAEGAGSSHLPLVLHEATHVLHACNYGHMDYRHEHPNAWNDWTHAAR